MHTNPTRSSTVFRLAALLVCGSFLGGCELPGFFADNFMPRPKIPAAYKPLDRTTVVMVDDPRGLLPSGQYANLIAERISRDLQTHKALTRVLRPQELWDLRHQHRDFADWPVDKVGREVGAEQVLYVVVDGFDFAGDTNDMYRPNAAARVKFVESQSGRRLFPEHNELDVRTTLFFKQKLFDRPSHAEQTQVMQKLAEHLGADIAAKFYDAKARETGSGYND